VVLIAEEASEVQSSAADPRSGSETSALMGEYGGHFKMKNGIGARCHLINVKPQRGQGSAACRGRAVPELMSPERRGV